MCNLSDFVLRRIAGTGVIAVIIMRKRRALPALLLVISACGVPRDAEVGEVGVTGSTDPSTSTTSGAAGSSEDGVDAGSTAATQESTQDSTGVLFDLGASDLPAPTSPCPCEPGTDDIFLLSNLAELWRFRPATADFERIGGFDCPGFSNVTFSLAVDHRGRAFVEYQTTGDIYRVDTEDPTCVDFGYAPPTAEPRRFGLGFVGSDDDLCETLLGVSFDGTQWSEGPGVGELVRFEGETLDRTTIEAIDFNGGELAATADGRVFLFAGVPEASLVRIDPQSGTVEERTDLSGVALSDAFAVAFWGGDFWFFTQSVDDPDRSQVLRLDYDESDGNGKALTTEIEHAELLVVGAASSTCAPLGPEG